MSKRVRTHTEGQTHFSKEFYKVGNDNYLTDFDAVQILDTENKIYAHFRYADNTPYIKRIIEVKYTATDHIRKQLRGEIPPVAQLVIFANLVAEINGSRSYTGMPHAQFYYLIQTDGEYPYHIFDITSTAKSIKYNYITKVEDREQLKDLANS